MACSQVASVKARHAALVMVEFKMSFWLLIKGPPWAAPSMYMVPEGALSAAPADTLMPVQRGRKWWGITADKDPLSALARME